MYIIDAKLNKRTSVLDDFSYSFMSCAEFNENFHVLCTSHVIRFTEIRYDTLDWRSFSNNVNQMQISRFWGSAESFTFLQKLSLLISGY